MRIASLPLVALFLGASLLACATTATIPDGDGGVGGPGPGAEAGPVADATPTCVDHCATNSDCQNSCPSISGDVNCCDESGRCYLSAATSCPAPVIDAGKMTSTY